MTLAGSVRSEPDASGGHGLDPALLAWLDAWKRQHGRPLRVLHVGNIANNAYLNARFLRGAGVDADVLCHSYYHVMASPEWERTGYEGSYGDDFAPRWGRLDPTRSLRPRWFVQGPLPACVRYLDARFEGRRWAERLWWAGLRLGGRLQPRPALWRLVQLAFELASRGVRIVRAAHRRLGTRGGARPAVRAAPKTVPASRWVRLFEARFPCRGDRLTAADTEVFLEHAPTWRRLFEHYDVVQCYATEPIRWLLAGGPPCVAYEHGTLRDFTLGDDPVHRLTALAYREAGHVFITNGDCLAYAERLGLRRFSPMIHPVDVDQHERVAEAEAAALRRRLDADVVLFCPVRHDWQVKGTDVHLRALPLIRRRVRGRVLLLLCRWGADLAASRELIASLACDDAVAWLRPLPRVPLIRTMKAADVVLDQMALPHFGATAPQALAAGRPVIMSYRPETTKWIVPEPAPILPAFDPEQVAEAVLCALDPEWRAEHRERARAWVHRYHHPDRIVREHLAVYRRLLDPPTTDVDAH